MGGSTKKGARAMSENVTTEPDEKYQGLLGWDRTFAHMWDLFFEPELRKRRDAGALSEDFSLFMAQVLFPPEGENRVLLNQAVQGVGLIRAPRPINKGDPLYLSDLAHLERFDLPDELLDNGHFTIIRHEEGWRMHFNFLSGRAKAKDMLDLASQFLLASKDSRDRGHSGPSIDNLFSAAELASKAELILHRSPSINSKKHGQVASAINAWAKLGNIDAAFVALFNKLGQQRPAARYGNSKNRPPPPSQEDTELVEAIIARGLSRVSKATDRAAEDVQAKSQ